MRTILFVIAFLSSFCCFSQVIEDFSDGDFTQNPAWTGDTDEFIVDGKKQLRLNAADGVSGYAGLYTSSAIVKETRWEFFTHLLFNPSANNYGIFFLTLNNPDFTNFSDGYVVRIGDEKDCISLCRMDRGKFETLIEGRPLMKEVGSPQLMIKAECDGEGNWSLWTRLLNNEGSYTKEGTIKDTIHPTSSFTGVGCIFTASRNKAFIFDNISVTSLSETPVNPDEPDEPDFPETGDSIPPRITSLIATADTIISIKFNEAINVAKASFSIDPIHKIQSKKLLDSGLSLELMLSSALENNREYTLVINGISDLSGNQMPSASVNFRYYDTSMQTVAFTDVVFSEIMANPDGNIALPESEYIELFNRTDFTVNLKGWKLVYGNKSYLLPETFLPSKGYVILCHQRFAGEWSDSGIEVVGLPAFPILANSGKLIYLEDSRSELVAWVDYSDTWYKDDFKKKGGFSLECVDTDNFSGSGNNWKASTDGRGGTPGKENSVKSVLPDDTDAEISHCYMESPDTITICFTKPMDLQTLSLVNSYQLKNAGYDILDRVPEYPKGNSVKLKLSKGIQEEIDVEVSGLKDISGYDLEGELTFGIGVPETAKAEDILFNEIMFNPFPGEDDYIELYNGSVKYISLDNLRFSSWKEDGSMSEPVYLTKEKRLFPPDSYLCFTKSPETAGERYTSCKNKLVKVSALPSLPDDRGNILLVNAGGEILDKLIYTEKMHSSLIDRKEGISLEKIYPGKGSQLSTNWLSASSISGGGTPGCRNSQFRESPEQTDKTFWLDNDSFSPDGDGTDDELLIFYKVSGENFQANLKIFDAGGHLVYILAEDYRLEPVGNFTWNGKDNEGRIAPLGIYILYIEAYNPVGEIKRFKLAFALTK